MAHNEQNIKYLLVDVDGTLTDAGIYYDSTGNELKKFSTRDAVGFVVARKAGIKLIVCTRRECEATARRMRELNVDYVFQKVLNKGDFLREFMETHSIEKSEMGYIGDDLNDLRAMHLAGYVACPADACPEIKEIADYVSVNEGGHGAVRDAIEHLLRHAGVWEQVVRAHYDQPI